MSLVLRRIVARHEAHTRLAANDRLEFMNIEPGDTLVIQTAKGIVTMKAQTHKKGGDSFAVIYLDKVVGFDPHRQVRTQLAYRETGRPDETQGLVFFDQKGKEWPVLKLTNVQMLPRNAGQGIDVD